MLTAPDGSPDELLTIDQAMAVLNASRSTLRDWRRDRRGPRWFRLSPKQIRYRRSDLESWLAECEVKPAS